MYNIIITGVQKEFVRESKKTVSNDEFKVLLLQHLNQLCSEEDIKNKYNVPSSLLNFRCKNYDDISIRKQRRTVKRSYFAHPPPIGKYDSIFLLEIFSPSRQKLDSEPKTPEIESITSKNEYGTSKTEFKTLANEFRPTETRYMTSEIGNSANDLKILENQFKTSENRFSTSDKGFICSCSPGPPGTPGAPGLIGPTGIPGPPGPKGEPGQNGKPGIPGAIGQKGNVGQKGEVGQIGENGPVGTPGPMGPTEPPGRDGIVPPEQVGSIGPKGEKGNRGETGQPGEEGAPGATGMKGSLGPVGPKGDKGGDSSEQPSVKGDYNNLSFNGPKGQQSVKGEQGSNSENGIDVSVSQSIAKRDGDSDIQKTNGEQQNQEGQEVFQFSNICSSCNFKIHNNTDILVKPYGKHHSVDFKTETPDCKHFAIAKMYSLGNAEEELNSVMVDSKPSNKEDTYKFWTTTNDNSKVFEFGNLDLLLKNKPTRTYDLGIAFDGNANVVYNGFFFYKMKGDKPKIVKYDFKTEQTQILLIPTLSRTVMKRLYQNKYNHFDFSVDQNGLWVIFSIPESENTAVAKLNHENMSVENMWEITIKNKNVIDMFIASGTLYTLEFTSTFDIQINLAVNLVSNIVTKINLTGIHQTGEITMATYDYQNQQILLIDGKERISYPFYCENSGILLPNMHTD